MALIACGALAQPCADLVSRSGWPVDVHPLPPLLHNRPGRIAGEVERLATELRGRYATVAVGYADCGTYGALDEVCGRLGLRRLPGLHCYDLYGGQDRIRALIDEQPGTYLLTDFLVRSFARTVLAELALPDLDERAIRKGERTGLERRRVPAFTVAQHEHLGVPVQHESPIRYCGDFYGHDDAGNPHPELVGREHLETLLPVERVAHLLESCCDALSYANAHGVIA